MNHPTTKFRYAAQALLDTINFQLEDIKDSAVLDSGATSHFLLASAPADDVTEATMLMPVQHPNGDRIQSTHTYKLPIPSLPASARIAHVMPGLALHSLLSILRLCNVGCDVTFTQIGCVVKYGGQVIL